MIVEVQYGDISQALHFGKLPEHMLKFAKDAESQDKGGDHILNVKSSTGFRIHNAAVVSQALAEFNQAVQALRAPALVVPEDPIVKENP